MHHENLMAGYSAVPVSPRLARAIVEEFMRNGRRTLTPGKVRYLRRIIRRSR